jgi:hypothetical protein
MNTAASAVIVAGAAPPSRALPESFDRHNPNVLTAMPRCWQNARTPMPLASHCEKICKRSMIHALFLRG